MNFYAGTGPAAAVLLTANVMGHARKRTHLRVYADEEQAWNSVWLTLTEPDSLHANPNRPGVTRIGDRRYQRWDSTIQQHVIVPAQILSAVEVAPGGGWSQFNASAGTHAAVTVYTTEEPLVDMQIQRWRTR